MRDDVNIFYQVTDGLDQRAIGAVLGQLSPEERARHDRFALARDRRDFAAAHALLRRALSAQAHRPRNEWTFVTGAHGKPRLRSDLDVHLSFNLAHTDGLVACAVTCAADIGIDVEAIDRRADALPLAHRYFSPIEIADLERCSEAERQTRFIEIWTLKEAYVKAIGDGLSRPLHEFGFVCHGSRSLRFESIGDARSEAWRFALFAPTSRHRLAIAVRDKFRHLRLFAVRIDGSDDRLVTVTSPPLRTSF